MNFRNSPHATAQVLWDGLYRHNFPRPVKTTSFLGRCNPIRVLERSAGGGSMAAGIQSVIMYINVLHFESYLSSLPGLNVDTASPFTWCAPWCRTCNAHKWQLWISREYSEYPVSTLCNLSFWFSTCSIIWHFGWPKCLGIHFQLGPFTFSIGWLWCHRHALNNIIFLGLPRLLWYC